MFFFYFFLVCIKWLFYELFKLLDDFKYTKLEKLHNFRKFSNITRKTYVKEESRYSQL